MSTLAKQPKKYLAPDNEVEIFGKDYGCGYFNCKSCDDGDAKIVLTSIMYIKYKCMLCNIKYILCHKCCIWTKKYILMDVIKYTPCESLSKRYEVYDTANNKIILLDKYASFMVRCNKCDNIWLIL